MLQIETYSAQNHRETEEKNRRDIFKPRVSFLNIFLPLSEVRQRFIYFIFHNFIINWRISSFIPYLILFTPQFFPDMPPFPSTQLFILFLKTV